MIWAAEMTAGAGGPRVVEPGASRYFFGATAAAALAGAPDVAGAAAGAAGAGAGITWGGETALPFAFISAK